MGLLNCNLSRFVLTCPQVEHAVLFRGKITWFLPNNHSVWALAQLEMRIFNQSKQLWKPEQLFCPPFMDTLTPVPDQIALSAHGKHSTKLGLSLLQCTKHPVCCSCPVLTHGSIAICPLPHLPPCLRYMASHSALFSMPWAC